jgi:hypothetical protein
MEDVRCISSVTGMALSMLRPITRPQKHSVVVGNATGHGTTTNLQNGPQHLAHVAHLKDGTNDKRG